MSVSTLTETAHEPRQVLFPSLAVSALVSTVLLISIGSIVRVTGHGLGCPDWPLCYGQAIPPALTGAWVEFSHRFMGVAVGAQIAALALLAWRQYRHERWVFWPAVAALALFLVQVGLGGLHVILELPPAIGWVHTGAAMLIAGLLAAQVAATWPALRELQRTPLRIFQDRPFAGWLSSTTAATYFLLLTGSYVTRSGASLACPAFPHCGADVPAIRHLIHIQVLHRYTAFGVAFLTLAIIGWLLLNAEHPLLRRLAVQLMGLLILQFLLGITNVLLRLPMWSRVLHLTVGAAFWAKLVVLWATMRAGRKASC